MTQNNVEVAVRHRLRLDLAAAAAAAAAAENSSGSRASDTLEASPLQPLELHPLVGGVLVDENQRRLLIRPVRLQDAHDKLQNMYGHCAARSTPSSVLLLPIYTLGGRGLGVGGRGEKMCACVEGVGLGEGTLLSHWAINLIL